MPNFSKSVCNLSKLKKSLDKDCRTPLCSFVLQLRQLIIIGSVLFLILFQITNISFQKHVQNVEVPIKQNLKPVESKTTQMLQVGNDKFDNLLQNDSSFIALARDQFLIPPSTDGYNLRFRWGDPAFREKQNLYVLKILKGLRNGFFIESGANDGETLSSTLVLERDYGWNGLLVEPDPYAYSELLKKNRKSWSSPACLSTGPYPQNVTFLHSLYSSTRSGIESMVRIPVGRVEKVNATCFPVFTLLSALKVDTVDYFCLDVEGVELKVLKTIPFDSVFIKVFSIEYEHIPEGPRALRSFMKSKGYLLVKKLVEGNARDYLFVHESLKDNLPRPKIPLRHVNSSSYE